MCPCLTVFVALLLSVVQLPNALAAITGTVVATGTYNGAAINSPPVTVNVDVQDPAPVLSVDSRAVSATYVQAGDVVTFEIDVTNSGNVTLSGIMVSDSVADTLVCPGGGATIATLAPAQRVTCTATVVVVAADVAAGSITNKAEASGTDPAGNPVGPARGGGTVFPTGLNLVTINSLGSGDPAPNVGDTVTFQIAVTNNGPLQATGVELTGLIPAGLTYVSDSGDGLYDPGTGIWTVGTVAAGATVTLEINATVDAGTSGQTIINSVAVTGLDQFDPTTAGDSLNASVTIRIPVIDAVDDGSAVVANGVAGSADHLNVFDNDTLDGALFAPSSVTVSALGQELGSYLILQPDGTIDIPPGTPRGSYRLIYRICDLANPTVCDMATATVVVEGPASIAGTVYRDSNGNGAYDAGLDGPQGGYTVELITGGIVIATTITAVDGGYNISPAPAGPGYRLVVRSPPGDITGGISNIALAPGENLINQDMAVDPSGVIYDALTRFPVAGAAVNLADTVGNPLPGVCLTDPASQGRATGTDGGYRFDIIPGASPACPAGETRYQILVVPPAGYVPGVSTILPPMAGDAEITACPFDVVSGGACQTVASNSPPPPGTPAVYALSVLLEAGDADFIHNHIPVDPIPNKANITVTKTADRRMIRRGERVGFVIDITNQDASAHPNLTLVDIVPAGFRYVSGSATVDGLLASAIETGAQLEFNNVDVGPNQTVSIRISLDALSTLGPGKYTNRTRLFDASGNLLAPEAVAAVEIGLEAVADCPDVTGFVFEDQNRNGHADDGEPGLAGVRLATVAGLLITTDRYGRFRVACTELPDKAIGSNFILKLDQKTLPAGYRMTTENPRVVRLTASKPVGMNFGAAGGRVVRLDLNGGAFEPGTDQLKPKWLAGVDQLIEVLRQEHSVLRIIYRMAEGEGDLAQKRVDAITITIKDRWHASSERYPIEIRSEVIE